MPRNGSGGYNLPTNSWNPAVNGVFATPADWQALIDDVAAAIQQSLSADGQTPMTGPLNLGGQQLKGLGAPTGPGDALRWQQLTLGANIASASEITVPVEGSLFAVTGSATVTSIANTYLGRVALLTFDAGVTLTNSANLKLPGGANIVTKAGEYGIFVNSATGVWECIYYNRPVVGNPWHGKAVGEIFYLQDNLTGVSAPPTNSEDFRYIKLTASDSYNSGVLTSEAIAGSAPEITATAVISLAGSPMNGVIVNLINTERRFLRAGGSGTFQNSQNRAHSHALSTDVRTVQAGGLSNDNSTNSVGSINNTLPDGGDEARPRNMGVTAFMRIK